MSLGIHICLDRVGDLGKQAWKYSLITAGYGNDYGWGSGLASACLG